jgi:phenylacetate-CoA ligase
LWIIFLNVNNDYRNYHWNISYHKKLLYLIYDIWRTGYGDQAAIAARQQARLVDLARFAMKQSLFYKNHYRDKGYLQPVTKHDLMANFDDWVTDPAVNISSVEVFLRDERHVGSLYLNRYAVFTTSGVTGKRGIFIHDTSALGIYTALGIARDSLGLINPGYIFSALTGGGRVAVVVATGGHFAGVAATEFARRFNPRLSKRVRTFSVMMPLPSIVKELNDFQPAILFGYPTAFLLLAYEQSAGRLAIHPLEVVTGGEWLAPLARKQIEQAFRCSVRDVYAASEFLGIAFDCGHGWLHVNADWVILEPVDESYLPVPAGKASSTVLLTNLANRVQPIIRYDLGDCITLRPDPCPCGSRLPAIRIEGRRDEILFLQEPGGGKIPVLPMAIATVVEETPGVQCFQVIQTAPATLRIRLEVMPGTDDGRVWESVAQRLREYLAAQGLSSVGVEKAGEPPMRDQVSGKFRQVWADMSIQKRFN